MIQNNVKKGGETPPWLMINCFGMFLIANYLKNKYINPHFEKLLLLQMNYLMRANLVKFLYLLLSLLAPIKP
jgi:hypothetical protein